MTTNEEKPTKRCVDCDRIVDYETALALADLVSSGALSNLDGFDEIAVHVTKTHHSYFLDEDSFGNQQVCVVCAPCIARALLADQLNASPNLSYSEYFANRQEL